MQFKLPAKMKNSCANLITKNKHEIEFGAINKSPITFLTECVTRKFEPNNIYYPVNVANSKKP